MTQTATILGTQQSLSAEAQEALRAAATWEVVDRPLTPGTFPARVRAARLALKQLLRNLALRGGTQMAENSNPALLELQASVRLLRSAMGGIFQQLKTVATLPRILLPEGQDEPRAAAVAAAFLRGAGRDFSAPVFQLFIQKLQEHEPLLVNELWNVSPFLGFVVLESLLAETRAFALSQDSALPCSVSAHIATLRSITNADWVALIEPLIVFDAVLRQDPAQTYAAMDFESREIYRQRVASIARHSDCSESQVAHAALELAREGTLHSAKDPRIQLRRIHVGYYLIDKGLPMLAARTEFHPPFIERVRTFIRAHADDFFINGIELIAILFIAALMLLPLAHSTLIGGLATALLLFLPAMQCAVEIVNNSVTALFDPFPLPKLDFSRGIPSDCTTLVTVPTLLPSEAQVRTLVNDLEVRFLANRDQNLHFALLTDLPDSISKPRANDSHPLVQLACQLVDELEGRYSASSGGGFLLLHRHRISNVRQGVWMGWERKRGKLLDLNKLLAGEFDAFPIKAGRIGALRDTRYVLTLDSDTQLPRGAAARLIGAIAHPLNQAVIHPESRTVVCGYGILQPRIGVSVSSASRSRMASIFSGQSGFDIYTRAISDAYQDLYGEGIFTGKGIYEAATLHAVLNHRFPRNSLLSHDLIEGAYARVGLASDIELIDDYPSHLSAYNRRKHRWVRGDWQIAQWMFSRVRDESGHSVRNPISAVARWKIFDNLRRSLVEPFTFVLFVAGWIGLSGGPLYWTLVPLCLLAFPTFVQLLFGLGRALLSGRKGSVGEVLSGFSKAALAALLNLVFLPHQTLLSLDAIFRALIRRFITGERLLEWETAAQAETGTSGSTAVDRYMLLAPLLAIAVAPLVFIAKPDGRYSLLVAAPILLVWGFSGIVTAWLNASPPPQSQRLDSAERAFLLGHALRIWRYFRQFGDAQHNYLIPDNVEEDDQLEAARVSPTNLGLLLNARQAACEFGFLTVPEFISLTNLTFATIARMEKHRGHLFNWYDTQTLDPLDRAPFISSVDSGNLVASLYTLRSGALALVGKPILPLHLFSALRVFLDSMRCNGGGKTPIGRLPLPSDSAGLAEWIDWLSPAATALSATVASPNGSHIDPWLVAEAQSRISAILALLSDYTPWLLPEFAPLRDLPGLDLGPHASTLAIEDAAAFSVALGDSLARVPASDPSLATLAAQLQGSLPAATRRLRNQAAALRAIATHAERLAQDTDFAFLADPGRRLLSIGYDVRAQKLHDACYDLIASEARIATFLAIARDQIPQQSWFKLGRDHALAGGEFVLLSWTGTMFEYLMPAIWMRSYPDTLISRTLAACVRVQRSFTRSLDIPWGISESGASRKDHAGHYHYQAYGVPRLALSPEATAGPIISPYSTFLAINTDSLAALRNLHRMATAGWVGAFGFYEAADFSTTPGKPDLVREWMAHHQGMSLLALLNLLHDNAAQRWFHANPLVQATELLLHEVPPSKTVLRARLQE
jgi:hypothetical protein